MLSFHCIQNQIPQPGSHVFLRDGSSHALDLVQGISYGASSTHPESYNGSWTWKWTSEVDWILSFFDFRHQDLDRSCSKFLPVVFRKCKPILHQKAQHPESHPWGSYSFWNIPSSLYSFVQFQQPILFIWMDHTNDPWSAIFKIISACRTWILWSNNWHDKKQQNHENKFPGRFFCMEHELPCWASFQTSHPISQTSDISQRNWTQD